MQAAGYAGLAAEARLSLRIVSVLEASIPRALAGTDGSQTLRWREMDSNF